MQKIDSLLKWPYKGDAQAQEKQNILENILRKKVRIDSQTVHFFTDVIWDLLYILSSFPNFLTINSWIKS